MSNENNTDADLPFWTKNDPVSKKDWEELETLKKRVQHPDPAIFHEIMDKPAEEETTPNPLEYVREHPGFRPSVQQFEDTLWRYADNESLRVYCLADGYWMAKKHNIYGQLLGCNDLSWAHMWQGMEATRNVQQAPFIIALKRGHPLNKWLIDNCWGRDEAVFFVGDTDIANFLYAGTPITDKRFLPSNEEQLKLGNLLEGADDPLWKMRRHFRSFTDVWLESEDKLVDFRYYSPWVLSSFMLFSDAAVRGRICAPIKLFMTEMSNLYPQFLNRKYYYLFNDEEFQRRDFTSDHVMKIAYSNEKETYRMNATPYLTISKKKLNEFSVFMDDSIEFYIREYVRIFMQLYYRRIGIEKDDSYYQDLDVLCRLYVLRAKKIGLHSMFARLQFTMAAVKHGVNYEKRDVILRRLIETQRSDRNTYAIEQHVDSLLYADSRLETE